MCFNIFLLQIYETKCSNRIAIDGIENNPRNVLVLDLFDNDERYYDFRHKKLED